MNGEVREFALQENDIPACQAGSRLPYLWGEWNEPELCAFVWEQFEKASNRRLSNKGQDN